MKSQIFLIFILLQFRQILTQNMASKQNFQITRMPRDNSDIEDTPSPEWIKYQQERFQNLDKLPASYRNFTENNLNKQQKVVATKINSKMETTSRQESYLLEEKDEPATTENTECNNNRDQNCNKDKLPITPSAVEFPSIKGFIEFIKTFKENWMKNSLFRIDDKIKRLYQLKDTLLKTIEQQFMILWQDDEEDDDNEDTEDETQNRSARKMQGNKHMIHIRHKRGILDESSINFPPDAALMSINFLTFAVFLIKLVLQVVNIIKTKHYQFSSMNMDTGAIRKG